MIDQNTFMETVRNVADIIRTSAVPMTEEEILAYFEDMDLDDGQKGLVMEYLMNPESEGESDSMDGQQAVDDVTDENEEEDSAKSRIFQMYLEELSLLPEYSQNEKEDLYRKLLQGETGVIETISTVWLQRVLTIAQKYLEPRLNVEDLVQEGNIALFLKLQMLCGSREAVDVENLLEQAVEEGVMSYASEMNSERELENTIVGKISLVHEAKKLLQEEKGHNPTMEELSEYTRIPVEELSDLEDMLKGIDDKRE